MLSGSYFNHDKTFNSVLVSICNECFIKSEALTVIRTKR